MLYKKVNMGVLETTKMPQVLSPCSSRRRSNDSTSPEFEFWMVRNPSNPQPDLHSADELFSGGVLLPLHQLHHQSSSSEPPPPPPTPLEEEAGQQNSSGNDSTRPGSEPGPGPDFSAAITNLSASGFTSSKRWKDIFKKSDKKCSSNDNDDVNDSNSKEKVKEKVKKKEKRNLGVGGGGAATAAELNINLWPFRRTRSAGNGGNRPRPSSAAATTRKVSSAPCSRSNSAGESKSKKWPSSPARGGVHLGRSSPIWQVRRATTASAAGGGRESGISGKSAEKGTRKDGNDSGRKLPAATGEGGGGQKGKILSINVPMCIGYRSQLSCRSDENSGVGVAAAASGGGSGGGESMEGVRGGNIFNIRSLFSKKVY